MNNIRKLIRETLERLMSEMEENIPHFRERVYDRLESDDTTFRNEKKNIKDIVFDNLKFLKKVNIETQDSIGFLIFKGPNRYIYHRELPNGKIEHSEGSFIWAVVRGNYLETLVFGDPNYKPQNTNIILYVDKLIDYIENENNGNFNITEKDIRKLLMPKQAQKTEQKPQDEIINIKGVKWLLDKKQEVLIKKNNPTVKVNVWDVLEDKIEDMIIDDKTKEEIMSFLI